MVYTVCFNMFFCVLRLWLYSRFQAYFPSLDSLLIVSPYDTDHLIFRVDTNDQNNLILNHPFDVISHPSYVTNRGRIVKLWAVLLTHLSLDKMEDIFKCIFVNEKFCILIQISLKFVPKGPIDNNPALF